MKNLSSTFVGPDYVMSWDMACHILHSAHSYIKATPKLAAKLESIEEHRADKIIVDPTRLHPAEMYVHIHQTLHNESDSEYVERSLVVSKEAQQKIMWREQLANHSSLTTDKNHIFPTRSTHEQQGIMRYMADSMLQVLNPAFANLAQYDKHTEMCAQLQHVKSDTLQAPANGFAGWLDKNLNPDRRWLNDVRYSIYNDYCGAIEDLTDVHDNVGSIINAAAHERKQANLASNSKLAQ